MYSAYLQSPSKVLFWGASRGPAFAGARLWRILPQCPVFAARISFPSPSRACAPRVSSARATPAQRSVSLTPTRPPRPGPSSRSPSPFAGFATAATGPSSAARGCARRARTLWLLDGRPACYWCCEARGVRGRAATLPRSQRAVHRQRRVLALFDGPPARLHPRPGRTMDRREQLDRSLRRSQMIERLHRMRGVEKVLGASRCEGAD